MTAHGTVGDGLLHQFSRPSSEFANPFVTDGTTLPGPLITREHRANLAHRAANRAEQSAEHVRLQARVYRRIVRTHDGGEPTPAVPALRLGELVATFALAQDNAFGQPLESQLRSCLLATWMADEAGYDAELKQTIYWVALLRYLGCTGHAREVAAYLGDEIAARARTLVHDSANPAEVARDVIALASAARPDQDPEQVAKYVLWRAAHNN
jgi:hypothetical protein